MVNLYELQHYPCCGTPDWFAHGGYSRSRWLTSSCQVGVDAANGIRKRGELFNVKSQEVGWSGESNELIDGKDGKDI